MNDEFLIKKPKRFGSRIVLLATSLLLILFCAFAVYAYVKIKRPTSSVSVPVTFSVPKGASTREVGVMLEDKNLVSSSYIFLGYALFSGGSGKIQAGDYLLDREMNMAQILDSLKQGKVSVSEKKVTVVEGWTNDQILELLQERGLVTSGQFGDALDVKHDFKFNPTGADFSYQGFLFPDTYNFSAAYDAEGIVQAMLENFESKFTEQMFSDMENKNLDLGDVIILASIIEREVGRGSSVSITDAVRATMQQEREKVASVFYNRLRIGMPLQSDATVNYVTGKSDRQARLDDLKVESPYNTYANTGLPPRPISNPGLDSIRAAIYPEQTDFLYFLSKKDGEAVFSRNLDEHNANKAKYLD